MSFIICDEVWESALSLLGITILGTGFSNTVDLRYSPCCIDYFYWPPVSLSSAANLAAPPLPSKVDYFLNAGYCVSLTVFCLLKAITFSRIS